MALQRVEKCRTCGELGCSKHKEVSKAFNPLAPTRLLGGAKSAMGGAKTAMGGAKSFGRGMGGGLGGVKPSGANGRIASAGGAFGGKLRAVGGQAGSQKVGLGLGAAGGAGLSSTFMGPKKPRQ
jgi:hypothetical protein